MTRPGRGSQLSLNQFFLLLTFEKGGTVHQDFQGESAFDPAAVNPPKTPFNVVTTPQHGVWQKIGWKAFAATLVAIEAGNDTSLSPPERERSRSSS
jgi:hypothetical protein